MSYKKKSELKQELLERGVSADKLDGLQRDDLVNLLESESDAHAEELAGESWDKMVKDEGEEAEASEWSEIMNLADEEAEDNPFVADEDVVENPKDKVPHHLTPEWESYVMEHFTDDELVEGAPTVAGLRRVAQLLVGPILECHCNPFEGPSQHNMYRAICACTVVYQDRRDGFVKKFSDCADVYDGNTDTTYAIFASATAATRAEARVLRKILMLTGPAADELTYKEAEAEEMSGLISGKQLRALDRFGRRLDINPRKYLNSGEDTYKDLRAIPFAKAQAMIEYISGIQNHPERIKEEWKPYVENWRKDNE